jgi:hypothetical protein
MSYFHLFYRTKIIIGLISLLFVKSIKISLIKDKAKDIIMNKDRPSLLVADTRVVETVSVLPDETSSGAIIPDATPSITIPPIEIIQDPTPPVKIFPDALSPVEKIPDVTPPVEKIPDVIPPIEIIQDATPPVAIIQDATPPAEKIPDAISSIAEPILSNPAVSNTGPNQGLVVYQNYDPNPDKGRDALRRKNGKKKSP